ncbi:MAG: hypothetical protein JWP97_6856, partial [Labilithrix sp.]|nr:hypothetical protein [Labilithrix sp.]
HSGLEDRAYYFWMIIGAGVVLGLSAFLVVRRR